jgi:hypothetical protein
MLPLIQTLHPILMVLHGVEDGDDGERACFGDDVLEAVEEDGEEDLEAVEDGELEECEVGEEDLLFLAEELD